MKLLTETFKKTGNIHHAYALEGEKNIILSRLFKFLEKDFGVEVKNNPDFSLQDYETFAIDDARALRDQHAKKAIGEKKIFIITTRFITTEAQNALLKIFEEPFPGTYFFLVMPNAEILIPTLRSRMVIVNDGDKADVMNFKDSRAEMKSLVKQFLAVGAGERLSLIKNIVEEKEKGKAIDFVTALEQALSDRASKKDFLENAKTLNDLLMIKKYLHDRAPSIKILLEHLCLSVKIK